MEAQQHRPQDHSYGEDEDELVVKGNKVGLKTALDDDPNAPKEDKSPSNYQCKVTDPTCANREEVGTTPLVESFEKMSVKEEKEVHAEKEGKSKSSDIGVSMKDYFAQKFKPRDEDKALSEVISGKLSGRKDETVETEREKPTEKVKQQVGVGTQKGSEEQRDVDVAAATHSECAGKSMIDRLKGVASSWLHKGGGKPAAAAQTPISTPPTPSTPGAT
ncbi:low-temperature-induced 78 kDa protein [Capsicum chacoense]